MIIGAIDRVIDFLCKVEWRVKKMLKKKFEYYKSLLSPDHPFFNFPMELVGDASADPTEFFNYYDAFAFWLFEKLMVKFNPPKPLETPVLFLIYNRIDTTRQVFEMIRKAKPPRLYIAADGPKEGVEGDVEKVKAVREYVLNNVDWDCEVKTLFRDKNLGCGKAVSEAITWFFENEEMGIILEDDTLPSLSFFWFCEELLEKYKDEKKVWHIGGCNFQDGIKRGKGDYYFSVYNHIWGWASWADRWRYYDFKLEKIKDGSFIRRVFSSKDEIKYWSKIFAKMKSPNPIDTWDYQWTFTMWYYGGLAILPNVNMISNIGLGQEATHTRGGISDLFNMKRYDLVIHNHPDQIIADREADEYTFRRVFAPKPVYIRAIKKINKFINKVRRRI